MTRFVKQPQNNKHPKNSPCRSHTATPVLPEENTNSPQYNQDNEPISNTCITIGSGNKLIEENEEQVEKITEDMKRFKAENDALIFVNKELEGINDKLKAEFEQSKLLYRLFYKGYIKIEGQSQKIHVESQESDDEVARTEIKEILKTLSSEYEMKYNKVFNSVDNKKIQNKLVPEFLRSLRPCYNPSYLKLKKWLHTLHKHQRDSYLLAYKGVQDQTNRWIHNNN
ncbi:11507_t:CDS:2 [Funneliformis geosporum]|uniref:8224_t:CDS:1 n=1 Tax=Funneliformis geosporum TaxID=1117311 RepID=A0A9W4SYJ8_9GLOM|nr:11507_t:CDS:2 [Funneliformis geosporum]CAI2185318.1 8224_t:CDS:2 [Funneliformis geosporum]